MSVATEPLLRQADAAVTPVIWVVRYAITENTLSPGRVTDEYVRRAIEDIGPGWEYR